MYLSDLSRAMLILTLATFATPAVAREAPACSAAAPLPTELAGWATPVAGIGVGARVADAPELEPGRAAPLRLVQGADVEYAVSVEGPDDAGFGGVLRFTVAEAGTWRIALASAAWIDVVADGKTVASSAHGHGAACSGIRKMVDFPLTPGSYVLQISGNATAETSVLLAPIGRAVD